MLRDFFLQIVIIITDKNSWLKNIFWLNQKLSKVVAHSFILLFLDFPLDERSVGPLFGGSRRD